MKYLTLLISFFLFTNLQAQRTQRWIEHYQDGYVGGFSVGLRETATHHNVQIDANNNVYFGYGSDALSASDFVTRSLTSTGDDRWNSSYAGSANAEDLVTSLAVSPDGNCYVTGYATETGEGQIITTIKYDTNGNQLWIAQLTDTPYVDSKANGIVLDADENVYIVGTAYVTNYNYDIVVIKYDKNGTRKWIKRYDRNLGPDNGQSICLSTNYGQVFVTGTTNITGGGDDFSTFAFNALNGNLQWEYHYDYLTGTGNPDNGIVVRTDTSGNVYAAANSYGGSNNDIVLIKFRGSDGSETWTKRYDDSLHGNDGVFDIVVSDFGNIYVGGHSIDGLGGATFLTLKYNAVGGLAWRSTFTGDSGRINRISNMCLGGPNQNLFVLGSAGTGINQSFTVRVLEYNPSTGDTLWTGDVGQESWSTQGTTTGLAVNDHGEVFVAGRSNSVVLAKFGEQTISIQELTPFKQISIFPIPAKNTIHIVNINDEQTVISLFDPMGKKVEIGVVQIDNKFVVTTEYKGVAFLKLSNLNNQTLTKKVIFSY